MLTTPSLEIAMFVPVLLGGIALLIAGSAAVVWIRERSRGKSEGVDASHS